MPNKLNSVKLYLDNFISTMVVVKGTNIAPQALCEQSSICCWSVSDNEANRLVNNPDREFEFAQHTDFEANPWIQLDFGKVVHYDEILVFNRLPLAERARTLSIEISIDCQGWHCIHICDPDAPPFGGTDGNPLRVLTPGYETRFIRLQLHEPNFFHLVAIEVYRHDS